MKNSIIFIAVLLCFSFAHTQDGDIKPNTVLYIIKTETNLIKTNHLFVDNKDLAGLDLPSKAEASKTLGSIKEDVVVYVTLKQGVKLLPLSRLLANYNLDVNYNNIPVYIDGEAISNPDDILSTETGLKHVKRTSNRIDISSKSPRLRNAKGLRH